VCAYLLSDLCALKSSLWRQFFYFSSPLWVRFFGEKEKSEISRTIKEQNYVHDDDDNNGRRRRRRPRARQHQQSFLFSTTERLDDVLLFFFFFFG